MQYTTKPKPIPLALASLLCASSVWAADAPALAKKPLPEKNVAIAQAVKPLAANANKRQSAQPDKPIQSAQTSSPVVPAATPLPAADAKAPVEAASEDKGKDKPAAGDGQPVMFKTMVIRQEVQRDTHYTSPVMRITREQIELQNAQTVEEAIKFMPSLQIRQRYPGDPNGVMAIRGSDMFSTGRNMVFVDGMPIHNFLQASYNGAPRWSMVGPNEVEAVDVVYGPYSAEYSGNSMGGVVNITTRMPQKREFYTESAIMIQPWNNPFGPTGGTNNVFLGNREFASYGDRFKDRLSVLASYNRIENNSQPMTFMMDNSGLSNAAGGTPVTGGAFTPDTIRTPSIIYGDTGSEHAVSSLYKIKLGFDITPTLLASFTTGYEYRTSTSTPNNYLTNTATGQPFWTNGSLVASQGGQRFDVNTQSFGRSESVRETLQVGGGINGKIAEDSKWTLNTNVSSFDVLRDNRGTAFASVFQPGGSAAGQLQNFNNYNWLNADAKLSTNELFNNKKLSLLYGYHFDQYNLGFQQSSMSNYSAGIGAVDPTKNNRGQTSTHAGFGQAAYRFRPGWDITAGVRYEDWSSSNGVVGNTSVPDRNLTATSPKASLGYEAGNWKYRYSFGRTHRFPVIAELFQSLSTPTQVLTANANLNPENGTHHNWSVDYLIPRGFVRASVFRDDVQDAIQSIRTVSGVITSSAFQNIDKTSSTGVELVFQQNRVLKSKFDFMANGTWMNVQVDHNSPNISYTPPN
ncbi:MAG: TonB-dependent receptor, partial [Nitrosospira sp.]|nr:TonB-dependent receptor [Nitrosospira sp.]